MFQAPNEIPVSDSIDRFSVQIIMAFGTYLATFLLTRGLTSLVSAVSENLGNSVNTLLWGFNFIVGSAVAMLASKMMDFFQKKGTMVREYRNNYLLSRLSGLFFDLMITAGIASIKIEDISGLWVPFILTVTAGAVVTWFFLKWAAGHAYPAYRHEGLISMYGMLTGTIGSGILLLKETADEWGTGIRIADSSSWIVRHVYIFVMIAYILLFGVLGGDQFIYFQF